MALMKILFLPDPRLRVVTKAVTTFDAALQTIIDDMFETMYAARGVGLAATQVGLDMQLAVIDVSQDGSKPYVVINPVIVESKEPTQMDEGCLSVPGTYDTVTRAKWVKMRALDREGKEYELEGEGVLAECIQHELDHLHGKLYIDQLSTFKQRRILEKVKKYLRQQKSNELS